MELIECQYLKLDLSKKKCNLRKGGIKKEAAFFMPPFIKIVYTRKPHLHLT